MNKPLPTISCNKCNMLQTYTGQADCKSCGQRLNNWSVASQLTVQSNNRKKNNDHEQDGA